MVPRPPAQTGSQVGACFTRRGATCRNFLTLSRPGRRKAGTGRRRTRVRIGSPEAPSAWTNPSLPGLLPHGQPSRGGRSSKSWRSAFSFIERHEEAVLTLLPPDLLLR